MKLFNRNFAVGERIEYMGWVNEGLISSTITWQSYKPRFLILKGTEVMLFESPPVSMFATEIHGNDKTHKAYRWKCNANGCINPGNKPKTKQNLFKFQHFNLNP